MRRRAALAAGRIGDPALVPPLVDLLDDPEVEVRRIAAFALGLVGDAAGFDRLLAALGDPDAGVRGRAAEALGRIGDPRAAPAIAKLVVDTLPKTISRMAVRGDDPANPADGWAEHRLALVALARLKDKAAAQTALLAGGRPRFDWWVATWVAMRLEDPALRPVLSAAAASDDPRSRALAARGLGALKDASAVELLLPLVRDPDETVALHALRALGQIGDARGTAAAAALVASPSETLRREALRALAVLPPDPALRPRLVALVAERNPWLRAAAFGALARTSPEDFALVLSGLDRDPDFRVRAALALALGAAASDMSIGVLHAMLADDDPRVLPAVLEALRRARGADALDTLRRHLEHADLGVRAAAAEQVAALGAKGQSAALVAAWQRGLADGAGELEARIAAVGALAAQQDDAARAGLARVAAEDPSRAVRAKAASALRAQGVTAPDPGPQAVERPRLDYRDAIAPVRPAPRRAALHAARVPAHAQGPGRDPPRRGERAAHGGLVRRAREARLLRRADVPPRGAGLRGAGRRPARRRQRRAGLRAALRGEPARVRPGRGRDGALGQGHRRQPVLRHALRPAAARRRVHAVRHGGRRAWTSSDRLQPGDAIERVEVWTGE